MASVIAQPVRSISSLFRLPFILYDSLSPFLSCHVHKDLFSFAANTESRERTQRRPFHPFACTECVRILLSVSSPFLFLLPFLLPLPLPPLPLVFASPQDNTTTLACRSAYRLRLCPFLCLAMRTCLAMLARPCPLAHPDPPACTWPQTSRGILLPRVMVVVDNTAHPDHA
jgi:hypothetical protein